VSNTRLASRSPSRVGAARFFRANRAWRGGRCCRSGARQVLLLQASAAERFGQHHPMIGQEGEQVLPIVAGDHHTRPAGGWCCRSAHSMSGRSLPSPTAAPGIPAAERVLESVVRLERSRSPRSGLGLSLVDAVARLHHARLILEHNTPPARASALSSRRRSDRQLGRRSFEHRGCRRPESRRPRPSRPRPRPSPPAQQATATKSATRELAGTIKSIDAELKTLQPRRRPQLRRRPAPPSSRP
jgi:hypothetical protein